MKKPVFYTEAAYGIGMVLLAVGTALTVYGDFGLSMVVAPAYILHLSLSPFFPFFSFGVAEYVLQALLLLLTMLLLRKAKLSYLLSFGAAILYGIVLDGAIGLTALLPAQLYLQIPLYLAGVLLCCSAIALLFCSYLPPAAYELLVKELSAKFQKPTHTVKTVYDMASLAITAIASLALFGTFQGIGIGTVLCALTYGIIIRFFQTRYTKWFHFTDKFPLRKHFE